MNKDQMMEQCISTLTGAGHSAEAAHDACAAAMDMMGGEAGLETPDAAAIPPGTVAKGLEEVKQPIRKFYVGEMKALNNGDIEAYVSTEAIDRVGDIIKAKGWSIDNYVKTGAPVLFSHDYSLPPIGKAIDIQIQRKGLWSITRFHEKTQLSRDLAILARGGDMKSWSVGFSALEPPESRTEDGVFKGYIFNKQELLEYSLVAVPANPEAVSKAIHMAHEGKISKQTAYIFAGPSPLADTDSGQDDKAQSADQATAILKGLNAATTVLRLRAGARK